MAEKATDGGEAHLHAPHSSAPETGERDKQEPAAKGGQEVQPAADDGHQMESEGSETKPGPGSAPQAESTNVSASHDAGSSEITYMPYESELELHHVMRLMKADLSEPYSIYTYRYFIHNWPNLCFLVCNSYSINTLEPCSRILMTRGHSPQT